MECWLISYYSDKEEIIAVYGLFGLVENVEEDLCVPTPPALYFHFTVLVKLTCQKCPRGLHPMLQ